MTRPLEPPFDGKPCPVCPLEVRNLSAIAHNLVLRLRGRSTSSDTGVEDLDRAVKMVAVNEQTHQAIVELRDAGQRFVSSVGGKRGFPVVDLDTARLAMQPLVEAHFADPKHCYREGF